MHFLGKALCQNVPEVVFCAARVCQRVVFVVPNGARKDKTMFLVGNLLIINGYIKEVVVCRRINKNKWELDKK